MESVKEEDGVVGTNGAKGHARVGSGRGGEEEGRDEAGEMHDCFFCVQERNVKKRQKSWRRR